MEPAAERVLVERDADLAALTHLLQQARSGHGTMAHVLGAAGVGKTTLLRALADVAGSDDMAVLNASAGRLETRSQFSLARRLFERTIAHLDEADRLALEDGPARVAVAHFLHRRGARPTQVEEVDMIASLYWVLCGLASTRPVLVTADDLQWADAESLHFLLALRERLHDLPVLVVTATREVGPDGRSPELAELIADRDSTTLRLGPLSPSGVAALLTRVWGVEPDVETNSRVVEVSGGNPFLVLALAHQLAPLDAAERTADRVVAEVPDRVIDSVVGRLAGLPYADRALAEALAVLDAAPIRLAAALAGIDLEVAVASADRLRAAGLVAPGSGLAWEHPLIGTAILETPGTDRREKLHRRAARLLADEPGMEDAAAAHLMSSQGVGDAEAARLLAGAAHRALDDGAPRTAVALLRRAVAEPPDRDELGTMLLRLGEAEASTSDDAAADTLRRAGTLVTTDANRCRCALALARVLSFAGEHEAAADVLEHTLHEVDRADPEHELELEAALIATGLLVAHRIPDVRRRLDARGDLAGTSRGERLFLIQQLSNAVGTNQSVDRISELAHRILDAGLQDPGSPEQSPESTDWVWTRLYLVFIGEYAEATRLVDEGFATAAERGSVVAFAATSFVAGQLSYSTGSFAAAEERFRSMVDIARGTRGLLIRSLAVSGLAQSLAMLGRTDEALPLLDEFPEIWPSGAPVSGVAAVEFSRAITRHAAGDHEGALRAALSVRDTMAKIDIDSPTWAAWREVAIEPLIALGRFDDARSFAAEHLQLCEEGGVPPLLGNALRLSALVTDDPEESVALLRRSVEMLAASEARFAEGVSRIALGAALRRAGVRREAQAELHAGRTLVEASGAVRLLASVDDELAIASGRRRLDAPAAALTPAEHRVAELAANGLRNQDIARTLYVSVKTVETQLSSTYRKLGITNRAALPTALATIDRPA